jgi:hypothetical protein
LEKPAEVFRIAVVGDSTGFGWQVQPTEAFPKVLQQNLNRAGRRKIEVINFSVPGYNTNQEHELLTTKALGFHPDLVILAMCPNDADVSRFLKSLTSKSNYLFSHTHLGHLLVYWADQYFQRRGMLVEERLWFRERILDQHYPDQLLLPTPGIEDVPQQGTRHSNPNTVPLRYVYQVGWTSVRSRLNDMKDILSARGVPFVVTGYFNDEMRAIVRELNFSASVDFWAEMTREGVDYASLQLNPDPHMNPKGHAYVAGLIERTLTNAQLLPNE